MGQRTKEEGEKVVELPKKVKEFIADEVSKLGLKDPESGKYVIGRRMFQALRKLLEVFVENVQDDFRSQLVVHFLQDVKLIELHLLPLLGSLILPEDAMEAEMALSLMKLILVVPLTKDIVQLQRALKKAFAKNAPVLMNLIIQISLNEEYSNVQVKARVFTVILTVLRALFTLPDLPYYLRESDDRMARNSHLLKALQKCKMTDFLIAATNDQENTLILGRKREILLLWAAIFSSIDPEQSASLLISGEKVVKKPIRHGRFSGAVVVQLATGQEVLLQNTSQILNNDSVDHLNVQKKTTRKQPRLEYLPHYTLFSQAELQYFQTFVSQFNTSCLPGLIETFLLVTEKLETDENLHCSVFGLFAFLLSFSPEPALVMALLQSRISLRAGQLLHKWLPMGKELSIPCLNICLYLSASLDLIVLLKSTNTSNNAEEYLEVAERNLCSQYDLMHGVSMLFTSLKSPTPNTLKKLVVTSSSIIKGMQRYCEGKALLYVTKRRAKKQEESEDEYEDFYKELSFPDYEEAFFTSVIVERLFSLLPGDSRMLSEKEQMALTDLLERVLKVKGGLVLRLRYMMLVYEALKTRVFVKELDTALLRVLTYIMDSCKHNLDYLYLLFGAFKLITPKKNNSVELDDSCKIEEISQFAEDTMEAVIKRLQEHEEVAIALWILDKLEQGMSNANPVENDLDGMRLFDDDEQAEDYINCSILADIDVRKQKLKLSLVRRFLELLELKEADSVWTLRLQRKDVNLYLTKLESVKEMIRKDDLAKTFYPFTTTPNEVVKKSKDESESSSSEFDSYTEEEETTEEQDERLPYRSDRFDRLRHIQFLKKRRREEFGKMVAEMKESSESPPDDTGDCSSPDIHDAKKFKIEEQEKENLISIRNDDQVKKRMNKKLRKNN